MSSPEGLLRAMFETAVASAQAEVCVPSNLPEPVSGSPRMRSVAAGRTVVAGAGKAAAAMARVLENNWPVVSEARRAGSSPPARQHHTPEGLVVTPYGHGVPCRHIEVVEAAHPVPDDAGREAAQRIIKLADNLTAEDQMIFLISGGASALLTLPADGISLADKQAVNRALLKSGATISEFNCVRKHISGIKGGRLAAAAHPARVVTLAISDVPGDDLSSIGSGPTVPDPTTREQARAILARYHVEPPDTISRHLLEPSNETPKPGQTYFHNNETRLIATPKQALATAAELARQNGLTSEVLGDAIEGEARDVASTHAELARAASPGTILLSGGELTVTVKGDGRGGPNAEYALALALALDGRPGIYAMACDTDGRDGTEDNAGALVTPNTLARARNAGLDARKYLENNDAYGFFAELGDLVVTGPTLTNINDFRAILVVR